MAGRSIELPDMSGKTVLVTGASSGIGRAAARRLAAAGATVLVHGRSPERTAEVAREIGTRAAGGRLRPLGRGPGAGREGPRPHRPPRCHASQRRRACRPAHVTPDGHELTFQANHLAAFLLQRLLEPLIVRDPGLPARGDKQRGQPPRPRGS